MREPLRRYYGYGDLHFITFSCHARRPLLGCALARDRFLKVLDEVRSAYGFRVAGYVVMPEHVHLLLSEPKRGTPSVALQIVKQRSSRALREERISVQGAEQSVGPLWMPRFHDFNVWSANRLNQKLEYMHLNPVKRELVNHPKDWAWSSWSFYANGEVGLVQIDPIL